MPLEPSGTPSMQAIQDAIDETVEDTGWVSLATDVSGSTAAYRVRGKVVQVVVGGSFSLSNATTATIVNGLIPAQYRTSVAFGLWGMAYLGGALVGIAVDSTGSVFARQATGSTVSGTAGGSITYIAD